MSLLLQARRGIVKLRQEASRRKSPPVVENTLMGAMRAFDAKLPPGIRPQEMALLCYRVLPGGGQCNQHLFQLLSGEVFCYTHGKVTR